MNIKTLVVIDNLKTGGVASSLYNFLKYMHNDIHISLLVFDETSLDISRIPSNIHIIKPNKFLHILGKSQSDIYKESLFFYFLRLFFVFIARFFNGELSRSILFSFIKNLGTYDFVLAYAQDNTWHSLSKGCIDLIVKRTISNNKACIIHCDYSNFGGFHVNQEKMLSKLNNIICVSESCSKSFISKFPSLKSKVIVCENFIDVEYIKSLSLTKETHLNMIRFVSVCRLSDVKGLDRTIAVFKELYDVGYHNFEWFIVGDGPEYDKLSKMVVSFGLDHCISFLGEKNNPYIYMANSDCFILPSYHEAAPMVFGECAALGVPVISTNTCSAKELVEERKIGIVVDNNSTGLKAAIKNYLDGKLLQDYIPTPIDCINIKPSIQWKNYYNCNS